MVDIVTDIIFGITCMFAMFYISILIKREINESRN